MTIFHPISDFLYELFPAAKGKGTEALVRAIRAFYVQGGFAPEVAEANGIIEVRSARARHAPQAHHAGACLRAGEEVPRGHTVQYFTAQHTRRIRRQHSELGLLQQRRPLFQGVGVQVVHPWLMPHSARGYPGAVVSFPDGRL